MDEKVYEEDVDYRKMYYRMAGAVESAIRLLITVQQECEEMLLEDAEREVPSRKAGG